MQQEFIQTEAFINRPMSIVLDAIRGGAALFVLMGHAVQHRLYTGPWPFTTMNLHNAVAIFFVLSGLVITNSAIQRRTSLGDYTLARAARILPVSIFAIGFSLLLYGVGQAAGLEVIKQTDPSEPFGLVGIVAPLVFLSESPIGEGLVWNPPYWSLVYEVWYYALFGAAFFLKGWARALALAVIAALAGIRVLLLFPVWLIGAALAKYAPSRPLPQLGSVICLVTGLTLIPLSNGLALDAASFLAGKIGIDVNILRFSSFALTDFMFGTGIALFFLGVRPLADQRAHLLERCKSPISWLADCSFSLYLLHWPIFNVLHGLGISAGNNPVLFIALLAVVVGLCGFLARFTEHRRRDVRLAIAGIFRPRVIAA